MMSTESSAINRQPTPVSCWLRLGGLAALLAGSVLQATPIPTTLTDFEVSGTQVGDAHPGAFLEADHCASCHQISEQDTAPVNSWRGSKMAHAGRNPLFFAQLATANQDAENVGYYCLRCHVPKSVISGNALASESAALSDSDRQGVDCHFCHSLVNPDYVAGESPVRDETVLAALESVPEYYANAMFVIDPDGVRRGTRPDASPYHERELSPFHTESALCGTCHDVGNVAVSRQGDGTWRYNALDTPVDDEDPWMQFPLERTYTEWKLSAFADGGVDMGGRFGGDGVSVVSSCQDCHMPRTAGRAAIMGPERSDLRTHEFAGASVWTLDIIGRHFADDPDVDAEAIAAGMARSRDMLGRAASLALEEVGGALRVRLFNETGHKLPTGHIEGRRAWLNVRVFNASDELLIEYGGYDPLQAELDTEWTMVYEMVVGLSEDAAAVTGLAPGPTGHMALADTIVKDTRIPPRGFDRSDFELGGAPVVGRDYADGQYWDDVYFRLPDGADRVEVTAWYQTATRQYIEELRDNNISDDWGDTLYALWQESGRSPPEIMGQVAAATSPFVRGDFNDNGALDPSDAESMLACFESETAVTDRCLIGDFTGDGRVTCEDFDSLDAQWPGPGATPRPMVCLLGAAGAVSVPSLSGPTGAILALTLLLAGLLGLAWRESGMT
ncbi:MAG: hypothetical protein HND55_12505 [Pseudomonadota bacterium]|nr:MAG: hypothetical protein HND55_12505 [Pseudomonadota bacterium]